MNMNEFLPDEATVSPRLTFPFRLHAILTQAEKLGMSHVMSWHSSGLKFIIYNHHHFASKILPNVFKQSKFASFRRQLNAYGFHREIKMEKSMKSSKKVTVYSHEHFRRDDPDACRKIIRKRQRHAIPDGVPGRAFNHTRSSDESNAEIAKTGITAKHQEQQYRQLLGGWHMPSQSYLESISSPALKPPVFTSKLALEKPMGKLCYTPNVENQAKQSVVMSLASHDVEDNLDRLSDKVLDELAETVSDDDDETSIGDFGSPEKIDWDPFVETLYS
mmetsp:Transcript_8181/g.12561  ORF Transcript_8181/g.12561 Transcript_8181/m.12561 type:complete len:275 (+) Transcript_8181:159-983(+)